MHSRVRLFAIPWTAAHQAPLSIGICQQGYWSRLPFPPSGDILDSGIEPVSPFVLALAGGLFTTELPGNHHLMPNVPQIYFLKICLLIDSGPPFFTGLLIEQP